jgi:hypothetical protein
MRSLRIGIAMSVAAFGCGSSSGGSDASALSGGSDASALSGGSSASAGSAAPAPPPAPPATFTEVYAMVFPRTTNAHCDMCHGLPPFEQSNGNFSTGFDRASTYASLVGKSSTSGACQGRVFVVPGKPEESLLLQKVLPDPPCGLRMPNGGAPLTDAQNELIRSWITAGALDN